MARSFRRQRVVVEGFQARFVVIQLVWIASLLFLFAALLFGPLVRRLLTDEAIASEVATLFLMLHRSVWPLLVGLFASIATVLILMSHRVAGPLFRFQQVFKEVTSGHGCRPAG